MAQSVRPQGTAFFARRADHHEIGSQRGRREDVVRSVAERRHDIYISLYIHGAGQET